jgi:hypothetical protein
MIDLQMQRVTRARNMELIDGGMPDQTTSGEMDRLTGLIGMKDNLMLTDFLFVLMPVVRVVAKAAEYSLNFRRWR